MASNGKQKRMTLAQAWHEATGDPMDVVLKRLKTLPKKDRPGVMKAMRERLDGIRQAAGSRVPNKRDPAGS